LVKQAPLRLAIPAHAAGLRLDHFLATLARDSDPTAGFLAQMSRSRIQQLISQGHVRCDAGVLRAATRLRGGEILQLQLPPADPSPLTPVAMPLAILFEDAHMVALNKPAGLVVHAGAGVRGPTLVQGLLAHCKDLSGIGGVLRPGIVHRLDRDTSGVLVVAKHDRAHVALARQFAQREVHKIYLAAVYGRPQPQKDRIDTLYGRHPHRRQLFTSQARLLGDSPNNSGLRQAVTVYETLAHAGGLSLLRLRLLTGRTHQIRVHLSDRGHPVVNDALYGSRTGQPILLQALQQLVQNLPPQALHAAKLSLRHPHSGAPLTLRAPLPVGMLALSKALVQGNTLAAST
jgi:23S rRNA pseudouridine1911/1915/1917 synthase